MHQGGFILKKGEHHCVPGHKGHKKQGERETSHWAEENRGRSNVPGGFHLMKQGSVALSLGHKRSGGNSGKTREKREREEGGKTGRKKGKEE
jgi:hypothetical protein